MRETSLERRAVRLIEKMGLLAPKAGQDGWPDRLVLVGPGRHIWLEFKTSAGSLTPAQKVRIPKLIARGEPVYVVRSIADVLAVLVKP